MVNENSEKDRRLWEHGIHEDNIFNNRLNFFLGFQSILFAVAGLLVSNLKTENELLVTLIVALGFVLSIFGWLIQAKQKLVLDGLRKRNKETFPEYFETIKQREKGFWKYFSVTWTLTHLIPIIMILVWGLLLAIVIFK